MITSDLAAHVESGVSMAVATRDAALRPDGVRALGARVDAGGETLTVFLPVAVAGRSLANLLDNGRIAVVFCRIRDHYTVQVKGAVVAIALADAAERERVDRYRRALAAELELPGLPDHVVFRVQHWPCFAVTFRPEAVFDQTPGPKAGELLRETTPRPPVVQPELTGEVVPPRTTPARFEDLDYACFQGLVPSLLATCDRAGEPNMTYLSQVHAMDRDHVALSCQFFNKTKRNLLEHPFSSLQLHHPLTFQAWRVELEFLREEKEGPLFDAMSARIDVIASHTGMAGIFRLLSADVQRILAIDRLDDFLLGDAGLSPDPSPVPPGTRLSELRGLQAISARIAGASDRPSLLASALEALDDLLGLDHTMVLGVEDGGERLVALLCHGYGPESVGGASIDFGTGVLGTAASTRRMARVSGIASGLRYGQAVRGRVESLDPSRCLRAPVGLPGLADAQAQLALPMLVGCELVGVLAAESRNPLAFDEWDEAFLQIVANQIGARLKSLGDAPPAPAPALVPAPPAGAGTRRFVYYRNDDAVFVDGEYLVRGTPGRILWKILTLDASTGQRELTNRELRLDRSLGLPAYRHNLESRLILLRKRLEDRCPDIRLVPVKRGRFALEADSAIVLEERDG